MSVYNTFKAYSTLDLTLVATDLTNRSIEAKAQTAPAQPAFNLTDVVNPISTGEVSILNGRAQLISVHMNSCP